MTMSPDLILRIQALHAKGLTNANIARRLNVDDSTVAYHISPERRAKKAAKELAKYHAKKETT